MSRFIVTGGAGFIGSNLVKKLLEEGHRVKVIDNLSTGKKENITEFLNDIEFKEIDIRDYAKLEPEFRDFEFILHQAALPSVARSVENPYDSFEVNCLGTVNVLTAAGKNNLKRVVFASSSSIYGNLASLPKYESDPVNPLSPYAVSKYAAEKITLQFYSLYGLETVALRYFNVFGPKQDPNSQYAAVIPRFITAFINGTIPEIYGDGDQSRDFTYIDNVVDANLKAAFSESGPGRFFNIACGERNSLNRLIKLLTEISGKNIKPKYFPERKCDVKHSQADIISAGDVIGYRPIISFNEGLKKTYNWFEKS